MSKVTKIDPPEGLSDKSKSLWASVEDRIVTEARAALIENALLILDRADQCRAIIEQDGILVKSERSGLDHPHSLLRQEAALRASFEKAWRKLGFHTFSK